MRIQLTSSRYTFRQATLTGHRASARGRLSDTRGLLLVIAVAFPADLVAHDATITTAAGVVAAALGRVRILKDDELQVFDA